MESGIYIITNKVNNKRYIGSSINLLQRKGKHFRDLRANRHDNSRLQRSFNKHGEDQFEFEILFTCPESEILRIEQIFINCYNPEYNILRIAYSTLGFKHSPETIQKLKNMRAGTKPHPSACINSGKKSSKSVYQYSLDDKLINEWSSTRAAARNLKIESTNISCCCRPNCKLKTYKNFKWSYTKYPDFQQLSEFCIAE